MDMIKLRTLANSIIERLSLRAATILFLIIAGMLLILLSVIISSISEFSVLIPGVLGVILLAIGVILAF